MTDYLNTYRRYACDIDRVNEEARHSPNGFVASAERIFRNDLHMIVDQICREPVNRHVVLLSGPSSSGKTTTSMRLADEFRNQGFDTKIISMDNFYLGKDKVDILPDGKPDFESVNALDIPPIKQCIHQLLTVGECEIPKYDFKHSRPSGESFPVKLSKNSAIIMEGIHALNPIFSDGVSDSGVTKIYVSVKQGIKDNEEYVLTNRDIRFIRRLVRDYSFRKVDPQYMLSMWDTVVDGEKKYIRPFRYKSDFTVNSLLIYEPCVMKKTAMSLFERIPADDPGRVFIDRLYAALERFEEIDPELVPTNSLLREFIGGGCYSY